MRWTKKVFSKKISLALSLVALVFMVMVLSIISAALLALLLNWLGLFDFDQEINPIIVMMYTFVFLGVVIAALLSKRSVKPIRDMMKATDKVAKGDFSVKVNGSFVLELDTLAQSFNKMVQDLRGVETLRSDFVRNFSHEFKTPIVSISGFAKLLKEGDISEEEKQDYLDSIIQESERLVELSTNVLNLSKVDTIEIISEKTLYRLDEQIRLAILMLEPKWNAKNHHMDIELKDEIEILGNKHLIHQVWINLLDNAIKYTDNGGTLKVSLYQSGRKAVFRLEDNGGGMSDETMHHLFDKFYQGHNSHYIAGNGLGLTLVKRIIDLCEGTIEVQSALGKGSVFTIRLPIDEIG
ncbi:HAMP domain-containing sensor histidine kinase [Amphibacillus cookii]|uniref:HAMP domain-containing sensor histidine kinase n=1 Tax=Amphibacillus cookii TaxID=767787 RepID=UPI00195EEBE0|nr:HAMP domain-containing sensor histidine kinase [Amphibacillus cookii]MBM7540131.1 signal transduction histidine kinase [Amphibacillus cookii]